MLILLRSQDDNSELAEVRIINYNYPAALCKTRLSAEYLSLPKWKLTRIKFDIIE